METDYSSKRTNERNGTFFTTIPCSSQHNMCDVRRVPKCSWMKVLSLLSCICRPRPYVRPSVASPAIQWLDLRLDLWISTRLSHKAQPDGWEMSWSEQAHCTVIALLTHKRTPKRGSKAYPLLLPRSCGNTTTEGIFQVHVRSEEGGWEVVALLVCLLPTNAGFSPVAHFLNDRDTLSRLPTRSGSSSSHFPREILFVPS